jgi:hypothetical protein
VPVAASLGDPDHRPHDARPVRQASTGPHVRSCWLRGEETLVSFPTALLLVFVMIAGPETQCHHARHRPRRPARRSTSMDAAPRFGVGANVGAARQVAGSDGTPIHPPGGLVA